MKMEYIKIFKTRKEDDKIVKSTIIIPKKDVECVHFVNEKIYIQTVNNSYAEIPENQEKYLERKRYFERAFGVEEENFSEEYIKIREKEEQLTEQFTRLIQGQTIGVVKPEEVRAFIFETAKQNVERG